MNTEGLSINLATVRQQFGLKDGVAAFVKHGVRGISPWREHVQAIGAELPKGSRDIAAARQMFADGMAAVLPHARAAKVPLAIEPLHPMYAADRGCISTLREALDLCDALGDGVGVAVDVYHVWWDPDLARQIARAG